MVFISNLSGLKSFPIASPLQIHCKLCLNVSLKAAMIRESQKTKGTRANSITKNPLTYTEYRYQREHSAYSTLSFM